MGDSPRWQPPVHTRRRPPVACHTAVRSLRRFIEGIAERYEALSASVFLKSSFPHNSTISRKPHRCRHVRGEYAGMGYIGASQRSAAERPTGEGARGLAPMPPDASPVSTPIASAWVPVPRSVFLVSPIPSVPRHPGPGDSDPSGCSGTGLSRGRRAGWVAVPEATGLSAGPLGCACGGELRQTRIARAPEPVGLSQNLKNLTFAMAVG